jgi:hypothetical protein
MHRRLNAAAPVALLLATLLLPGCDAPQAPVKTAPAPTARETISPVAAPDPVPAPVPVPKPDDARPLVERHSPGPLKLTIDNDPRAGQRAASFGTAPQPDWLDTGPAAGGATDPLLPDLFDTQSDSKAMSVKGKILTNGGSEGASTAIDGAGVNIRIPTE